MLQIDFSDTAGLVSAGLRMVLVRLGTGMGDVLDLFARNTLTNNLPHSFLQYFVPPSTDSRKGWLDSNIRNNANDWVGRLSG